MFLARRSYAIGNVADVFKQTVVSNLLQEYTQQPRPWSFIDFNAGGGGANVLEVVSSAAVTKAYRFGVQRVWDRIQQRKWGTSECDAVMDKYAQALVHYNKKFRMEMSQNRSAWDSLSPELRSETALAWLPSMGQLVRFFMGPRDQGVFVEPETDDFQQLQALFHGDRRCKTLHLASDRAAHVVTPPRNHNGIAYFDPPNGVRNLKAALDAIEITAKRWPTSTQVLTYTIDDLNSRGVLYNKLRDYGFRDVIGGEILLRPDGDNVMNSDAAIRGSGLGVAICNPPGLFIKRLELILTMLARDFDGHPIGNEKVQTFACELLPKYEDDLWNGPVPDTAAFRKLPLFQPLLDLDTVKEVDEAVDAGKMKQELEAVDLYLLRTGAIKVKAIEDKLRKKYPYAGTEQQLAVMEDLALSERLHTVAAAQEPERPELPIFERERARKALRDAGVTSENFHHFEQAYPTLVSLQQKATASAAARRRRLMDAAKQATQAGDIRTPDAGRNLKTGQPSVTGSSKPKSLLSLVKQREVLNRVMESAKQRREEARSKLFEDAK